MPRKKQIEPNVNFCPPYPIAVVTPVGRSEGKYLEELAHSMLGLSAVLDSPVEWVLALDGSATSVEEVRDWTVAAASGASLLVIPAPSSEPTGPGSTRNRALSRVTAPWMAAIDSDDTFDPEGMLALLNAVKARPDIAWVAGETWDVAPDGSFLSYGPPDTPPEGINVRGTVFVRRASLGSPPFHPSATIARTDVVRRVGGWPEGWFRTEDSALWSVIDAWLHGMWVPVHVLNYRKHPSSITQSPSYVGTAPELMPEIAEFIRRGYINLSDYR